MVECTKPTVLQIYNSCEDGPMNNSEELKKALANASIPQVIGLMLDETLQYHQYIPDDEIRVLKELRYLLTYLKEPSPSSFQRICRHMFNITVHEPSQKKMDSYTEVFIQEVCKRIRVLFRLELHHYRPKQITDSKFDEKKPE